MSESTADPRCVEYDQSTSASHDRIRRGSVSLVLFFTVTTLYTFTTAGLGLYIATLSRNLVQAAMLAILVLIP